MGQCVSNVRPVCCHLNLTMDQLDRLAELAAASRVLELSPDQRAQLTDAATAHAAGFVDSLDTRPVYQPEHDDGSNVLRVSESASSMEDALKILAEHIESNGQNTGSSRFFAYIPSGGLYTGALGSYLGAVNNRYSGVRFAAPGGARLERNLVRWLADEVGYPAGAEGDLTSGGSIATLSALVAARQAHDIRAREIENAVVYMTRLTHHCVPKAMRIAGLEECRTRYVPLDENYRMDPQALEQAIASDHEAGLRPWLIVGTAGTTDRGTVDPLSDLADIADQHDMWLHVDAAYGGAFVLCDEGKRRLKGLERSQSLVLDPHKGLFLPVGVGALLVRSRESLYEAFHARGAYMQDFKGEGVDADISPTDLSPELTRPFRALQMWLPLKLHGLAPFRAALEEKLLLAEYFYDRINQIKGFETGPRPDLSIVPFRYVPSRGDPNEFNRRLSEAMREDGRAFMTTTTLDGLFQIRMAILSYHSHREDVDTALELIQENTAALAVE